MLTKFNQLYSKILFQHTMNNQSGFKDADQLLEVAYDKVGFKKFEQLKNNQDFINKLNNTDKDIIKDAYEGLWQDSIKNYDDDQEDMKNEAIKFYNYLKEFYLNK